MNDVHIKAWRIYIVPFLQCSAYKLKKLATVCDDALIIHEMLNMTEHEIRCMVCAVYSSHPTKNADIAHVRTITARS